MAIFKEPPMVRYLTENERDDYYMSWVIKNGKPKQNQGCINCAELTCYRDCLGITDKRVNKMNYTITFLAE
jgi:hypothetical protein